MTLPVLTAISDPSVEAALVAAFGSESLGVVVTRRCVDLADLLATAAAGTGQAVLVSADLRGLDQGAVAGLRRAGLAVVGLAPARDESAQRRLLQIGVDEVLPADASASRLATTLLALAARPSADAPRQAAAMPGAAPLGEGGGWGPGWDGDASEVEPLTAPGQLIAVWGPAGAPGRTTVAAGLAAELAAGGLPVLLIDADPYGGCIAQLLGMLEEAPGVAAGDEGSQLRNSGRFAAGVVGPFGEHAGWVDASRAHRHQPRRPVDRAAPGRCVDCARPGTAARGGDGDRLRIQS